jgi:hypothetical protein
MDSRKIFVARKVTDVKRARLLERCYLRLWPSLARHWPSAVILNDEHCGESRPFITCSGQST